MKKIKYNFLLIKIFINVNINVPIIMTIEQIIIIYY